MPLCLRRTKKKTRGLIHGIAKWINQYHLNDTSRCPILHGQEPFIERSLDIQNIKLGSHKRTVTDFEKNNHNYRSSGLCTTTNQVQFLLSISVQTDGPSTVIGYPMNLRAQIRFSVNIIMHTNGTAVVTKVVRIVVIASTSVGLSDAEVALFCVVFNTH